jgi:hypothetical protein
VEQVCDTFTQRRVYVDARGRLSLCCQLSEYGDNEADVVADLNHASLLEVWPRYTDRLAALQRASAEMRAGGGELDPFPCIRCARALGKMEWVRQYPDSPWHAAAAASPPQPPRLVGLSYRRTLQTA